MPPTAYMQMSTGPHHTALWAAGTTQENAGTLAPTTAVNCPLFLTQKSGGSTRLWQTNLLALSRAKSQVLHSGPQE